MSIILFISLQNYIMNLFCLLPMSKSLSLVVAFKLLV